MDGYSTELDREIPEELVEEFLKRIPYLSEGIHSFRLTPGSQRVSFELLPGFEDQADTVAGRIAEVADKFTINYRPAPPKVLVKREGRQVGYDDPHTALIQQGELTEFGRGRYGFGPKLVGL